MTLSITVDGVIYENSTQLTDAPAVSITATGVTFVNSSGALVFSTTSGTAALVLGQGGNTVRNNADAVIAAFGVDEIAILGSSGSDTIENAGAITGWTSLGSGNDSYALRTAASTALNSRVDLGDGDDALHFVDTLGSLFYNPQALGGSGFDTLYLSGAISHLEAGAITGFERLSIVNGGGSGLNIIGLSGLSQIDIVNTASVNFLGSNNPLVDLAMTGGFVTLAAGSTVHSVTGSADAEQLQLSFLSAPHTPVLASIDLGGGDDTLWLTQFTAAQFLPTLPAMVQGGSGFDQVFLSVLVETTIDMTQFAGFEGVNTGTFSSGNSAVRLIHLDAFVLADADPFGSLTIGLTSAPGLLVRPNAQSTIAIEATATIGAIGYPTEPGMVTDLDAIATPSTFSSFSIYSTGNILGDVQLSLGNDLFDGRGGAVGGVIHGYAGNDTIYGGSGVEAIEGGYGADTIDGGGGTDRIDGGFGDDRMWGGSGTDTFVFSRRLFGQDTLGDFAPGELIDVSRLHIADFATLAAFMTQSGSDVIISLGYASQSETIRIENTALASLTAANFVFDTSADRHADFGTSGNDVIFGAGGSDQLMGGDGDDLIIGGSGNDLLSGDAGNDVLRGEIGDDSYVVDGQNDLVFEAPGSGYDRIFSSGDFYLYAEVEELGLLGSADLFGVGNELDNKLTGNSGANLLIGGLGNDTVFAGAGNDLVFGGDGNDILLGEDGVDYLVGGTGSDSMMGGNGADALYGGDGDDGLNGGASFDTDILVGGNGNDGLDAASGLGDYDILNGGLGNDLYFVDTPADIIYEAAGEGTDVVYANISGAGYYLWANVENCILQGTTPFAAGNELNNDLVGSDSANWLLGNDGNDLLWGGAGNDVLFGDRPDGTAGNDIFAFRMTDGQDVIGDFHQGQDRIRLVGGYSTFAEISQHFVQNGADGAIDFGNGNFVVLVGVDMSTLTAADFHII